MNNSSQNKTGFLRNRKLESWIILTLFIVILLTGPLAKAVDLSRYSLCDIEVLYVYDDPGSIDWATIYHLNEYYHCRVTLLTINQGSEFRIVETGFENRQLVALTVFKTSDTTGFIDKLSDKLFKNRQPDMIILSELTKQTVYESFVSHLINLPKDDNSPFKIIKILKWQRANDVSLTNRSFSVNTAELAETYHDRMVIEVPNLVISANLKTYDPPRFSRYSMVYADDTIENVRRGLLDGIAQLRLISILDGYLGEGPVESAILRHARNFISFSSLSNNSTGAKKVKHLVSGYKSLLDLNNQCRSLAVLKNETGLLSYLDNLINKSRQAVLAEIRVDWSGDIIRRDSPHGPKLKFRASLAVNGPQEVELSYIRFHPYWDSTVVVLENESRKVLPHQSFVREYLIDIERSHLESKLPDSLKFTAELVYRSLSLPVTSAIAVRDIPSLSVKFEPKFHFVPPVARVDIDQVVSTMNLKAVITKPYDYSGTVTLNLATPRGMFAGAYKTTWELSQGRTTETVRIPFSVSNLFEQGIQELIIELSADNLIIDTDTGLVRIASCKVSDKVNIGLFPDTTGHIEDILRMTQVRFQPMTERSLVTADLNAYQVLILGSGFFRKYPSIAKAKDRLEDYLRHGGSLVIFGQPTDWPEGLLPVSFVPTSERVRSKEIIVRLPEGKVVSEGYDIQFDQLLSHFKRERQVAPIVMSPSEGVLITKSGAGLLSVARIGEGQIIYCGLPLTEMIAKLNLEAIHLFANLLNY